MSSNAQQSSTFDPNDVENEKGKLGSNLANLVGNHPIGVIVGAVAIYAIGYQIGRNDSLEGIFRVAMAS